MKIPTSIIGAMKWINSRFPFEGLTEKDYMQAQELLGRLPIISNVPDYRGLDPWSRVGSLLGEAVLQTGEIGFLAEIKYFLSTPGKRGLHFREELTEVVGRSHDGNMVYVGTNSIAERCMGNSSLGSFPFPLTHFYVNPRVVVPKDKGSRYVDQEDGAIPASNIVSITPYKITDMIMGKEEVMEFLLNNVNPFSPKDTTDFDDYMHSLGVSYPARPLGSKDLIRGDLLQGNFVLPSQFIALVGYHCRSDDERIFLDTHSEQTPFQIGGFFCYDDTGSPQQDTFRLFRMFHDPIETIHSSLYVGPLGPAESVPLPEGKVISKYFPRSRGAPYIEFGPLGARWINHLAILEKGFQPFGDVAASLHLLEPTKNQEYVPVTRVINFIDDSSPGGIDHMYEYLAACAVPPKRLASKLRESGLRVIEINPKGELITRSSPFGGACYSPYKRSSGTKSGLLIDTVKVSPTTIIDDLMLPGDHIFVENLKPREYFNEVTDTGLDRVLSDPRITKHI